jgi:hypothetical protein
MRDDPLDHESVFDRAHRLEHERATGVTPEDAALLKALDDARDDPQDFAEQLFAYYDDNDRVRRTPRELMYLHLGACTTMIKRAASFDARLAHTLFITMRTEELRHLLAAHHTDLAHATTPESIAFGGGRIALIEAVLKTREQK